MGTRPQQTRRYKRLCGLLQEQKEQSGLTNRELGERLRKPHSFVYKTEHGERRIDPVEFVDWCRACGLDPLEEFQSLIDRIGKN